MQELRGILRVIASYTAILLERSDDERDQADLQQILHFHELAEILSGGSGPPGKEVAAGCVTEARVAHLLALIGQVEQRALTAAARAARER